MGCRFSRLPQPVMGRQIPVAGAKFRKPGLEHQEVLAFFIGNLDPVISKGRRKWLARVCRKACEEVASQVDCIEFDMG